MGWRVQVLASGAQVLVGDVDAQGCAKKNQVEPLNPEPQNPKP